MSRKSYPAYKQSGVEWLGDLPAHWRICPLRTLYRRKSDRNHPGLPLLSVYRDYGVIPKDSRDDNFNKPSLDLSAYLRIEPTDLVTNKMKTWQGSIAVSDYEGIVSPAYYTCRAQHQENHRFIHYLLRCEKYTSIYMTLSKGIRVNQWDLEYEEFRNIPVLLPPLKEQRPIATFLDRETARIDSLIEKKKRQIELLQEKRSALISHAVTKGLDPNVKMKDSGIEWLGEIPEHWKCMAVKRICNLTGRIGFRGYSTADIVGEHEGAITLSPTNMNYGMIDLKICTFLSWDKYYESPEIMVEKDDILLVKTGSTYGKVSYVNSVNYPQTINPQIMILKAKQVVPKFLFYLFASTHLQILLRLLNTGSTIPTMTQEAVGCLQIPITDIPEQNAIVDVLDRKTIRIDTLVEKVQESIEKLREYRAALISAAVTGKIDVRDKLSA